MYVITNDYIFKLQKLIDFGQLLGVATPRPQKSCTTFMMCAPPCMSGLESPRIFSILRL